VESIELRMSKKSTKNSAAKPPIFKGDDKQFKFERQKTKTDEPSSNA
jgi:hypothetical protein